MIIVDVEFSKTIFITSYLREPEIKILIFIVRHDDFAVYCYQEMRRHLVFASTNNFVANTFHLIYWIIFRSVELIYTIWQWKTSQHANEIVTVCAQINFCIKTSFHSNSISLQNKTSLKTRNNHFIFILACRNHTISL